MAGNNEIHYGGIPGPFKILGIVEISHKFPGVFCSRPVRGAGAGTGLRSGGAGPGASPAVAGPGTKRGGDLKGQVRVAGPAGPLGSPAVITLISSYKRIPTVLHHVIPTTRGPRQRAQPEW